MFKQTRIRLTLFYSAIFATFLMIFIIVLGAGMFWLTYFERKEEIKHLAQEIAEEQRPKLVDYYQNGQWQTERDYKSDHDISGLVFYSVYDRDENIVKSGDPVPMLKNFFYAEIQRWVHHERSIRIKIFQMSDGKKVVLLFTSKAIFDAQQDLLGRVYVAKDITADYRVLVNIVTVLTGVALLFTCIAAILAYLLAGSVMAPLFQMFNRQKQFLADVSHELRTPLSVLLTSIDTIEEDQHTVISKSSVQILADMQDEIQKLTNIIRDLLTMARTEMGDIKLKVERFDLKRVAEQVQRTLQTTAQLKGVELNLEVSGVVDIEADRERIRQLLFILVDNGIKYSCCGDQVFMRVKCVQDSGKPVVEISVLDTGIGIDSEYQEQIFERSFRVGSVKSDAVDGNGLGLAIAKWIVELHGGTICVQSEIGQGSTFQVVIPTKIC